MSRSTTYFTAIAAATLAAGLGVGLDSGCLHKGEVKQNAIQLVDCTGASVLKSTTQIMFEVLNALANTDTAKTKAELTALAGIAGIDAVMCAADVIRRDIAPGESASQLANQAPLVVTVVTNANMFLLNKEIRF